MKNLFTMLLSTLLITLMFCPDVFAQATNASILGVITDGNNRPVAGVSVSVKNESTGFQNTTTTNENGAYLFQQLPLGKPYTIRVKHLNYHEATERG